MSLGRTTCFESAHAGLSLAASAAALSSDMVILPMIKLIGFGLMGARGAALLPRDAKKVFTSDGTCLETESIVSLCIDLNLSGLYSWEVNPFSDFYFLTMSKCYRLVYRGIDFVNRVIPSIEIPLKWLLMPKFVL